MSYEQKDGKGSLFKNDKEGNANRPDLKGSIKIDGREFWLSAWTKVGDKGKWLSLSAEPKFARDGKSPPVASRGVDDDIPY